VLDTVANDGLVVHVNGVEVGRDNMPDGPVGHLTWATSSPLVSTATPTVVEVPTDLLVDGTNVIAAETHVRYRTTPDLSFELAAELTTVPSGAPLAPVAALGVDVSVLSVSVDGSGSSDVDGEVVGYAWDFGDGATATGVTAEHTYAAAGEYTIALTVTDDSGLEATATRTVSVSESSEPVTEVVVERDADWSWYYQAAAPAAGWNDVGVDRTGWQSGAAPLGWGFAGVVTDIDIDGPATDRPRTAYFVNEFEVVDADRVVSLVLDTVANDGLVVHVNGVEVGRDNMPDGPVGHLTWADSARRVDVANADPVVVEVPTDLLVDGTNVIAAETHVNYRNTPDVSFELDAELTTSP
jgi:PKD repeat protein